MKIIQDKQNPLLRRREIKIIVKAAKNPTMQQVTKLVSEQFKTAEENLAVKLIKGKFGRNTFLIVVNIYDSKEDKDKIEPKQKIKKDETKEKKVGEEETIAEQQKEKPEEKPEKPPTEEKKTEQEAEQPKEEKKRK